MQRFHRALRAGGWHHSRGASVLLSIHVLLALALALAAHAEDILPTGELPLGPLQQAESFGTHLDIEGDLAAVSAPGEAAVREYRWDATTRTWRFHVYHGPLGREVLALATNGTSIAVAADVSPGGLQGVSFKVFFITTGMGRVELTDFDSRPRALAYSGDILAMASRDTGISPAADVTFFRFDGSTVEELDSHDLTGALFGPFHFSVAMSGPRVVVGDPARGASGAVHDFIRVGDEWMSLGVISPPDLQQVDEGFGWSVDLDGEWLSVGAPFTDWPRGSNAVTDAGLVHLYKTGFLGLFEARGFLNHDDHSLMTQVSDEAGTSVALHAGNLLVGVPGADPFALSAAGMAFSWTKISDLWVPQDRLFNSLVAEEAFGHALSVNRHGILIGAPDSSGATGKTYIFDPLPTIFIDGFESGDIAAWNGP